jgi:hypothetical protein
MPDFFIDILPLLGLFEHASSMLAISECDEKTVGVFALLPAFKLKLLFEIDALNYFPYDGLFQGSRIVTFYLNK